MTSTNDIIKHLETPIDVMLLMHKAFVIHSERTELLAKAAQSGGDLSELRISLDEWLKQLLYHTHTEDIYMTGPLTDVEHADGRHPARDSEQEHEELRKLGGGIFNFMEGGEDAGLSDEISSFIRSLDDYEHDELLNKAHQAERALKSALGETRVLARTRRHLYKRVMEFRIAEFDHFENEEAFVLPMVREQMGPAQELECSRKLLFDDNAENPRWVIDFIYRDLEESEKELLKELELSFSVTSPG